MKIVFLKVVFIKIVYLLLFILCFLLNLGCLTGPRGGPGFPGKKLQKSVLYAKALGFRLLSFDAFRPTEAQSILWNHTPNSNFLSNPTSGSPHSRGVAVDLTLLEQNGKPLDMGTDFDSFSTKSQHGNQQISSRAQKNRLILLGLMTQAGWDFYKNEWWHYQLHNSKIYPLISNLQTPKPLL